MPKPPIVLRAVTAAKAALTGLALAAGLASLPGAARAEDAVVARVVTTQALPRFDALAASTAALARLAAQAAQAPEGAQCAAQSGALRAAWMQAMDDWTAAQAFRIGPLEDHGLAIAFWPDAKSATPRGLRALLQAPDLPADYAQQSVAVRGLYALEMLLYDQSLADIAPAGRLCALIAAASADLAASAGQTAQEWHSAFAPLLLAPGSPGNSRYLSDHEARQALFTQLVTQLGFDAETRLDRPLGSLERPRPERAEQRLSGRALRNLALSLAANRALAQAMTLGGTEYLFDYFTYAQGVAARLDDPVFAGVADPTGRMKVYELKSALERIHDAANAELAAELQVSAGFNALDGD